MRVRTPSAGSLPRIGGINIEWNRLPTTFMHHAAGAGLGVAFDRGCGFNDAVEGIVPAGDTAIGMIIRPPAPVDQIAKFVAASYRQIDGGAPDPVSLLAQGRGRWVPGVEVGHHTHPAGPQGGGKFEDHPDMPRDRRGVFDDHGPTHGT